MDVREVQGSGTVCSHPANAQGHPACAGTSGIRRLERDLIYKPCGRRSLRVGDLDPGFVALSPTGIGNPTAFLAECRCDAARFPALLHVRGIIARHRAGEPVFRAMGVDPFPDVFRIASVSSGDVDGAAVAIAAGSPASAMQGVAAAGLEACGETLAIVV